MDHSIVSCMPSITRFSKTCCKSVTIMTSSFLIPKAIWFIRFLRSWIMPQICIAANGKTLTLPMPIRPQSKDKMKRFSFSILSPMSQAMAPRHPSCQRPFFPMVKKLECWPFKCRLLNLTTAWPKLRENQKAQSII